MEKTHTRLVIIYQGKLSKKKDEEIIKAIGEKHNTGSGYGFGERDISFVFKTNRSLKNAVKKAEKIKNIEVKTYNE